MWLENNNLSVTKSVTKVQKNTQKYTKKRKKLKFLQKVAAECLGRGEKPRLVARKLNIALRTIYCWLEIPEFVEAKEKASAEAIEKVRYTLDNSRESIIHALCSSAANEKSEHSKDRVTYFKLTGELTDRFQEVPWGENRSLEELDHFAKYGKWPEEK